MKIAIISTSINPNPAAYVEWSDIGRLHVAGDMNSPPELKAFVEKLGGVYVTTQRQDEYHCSESIGWRNIQRRNLALLAAFDTEQYDYFIAVDDDNFPGENVQKFHDTVRATFANLSGIRAQAHDTMWYNPGMLGEPYYRQRGLPARLMTDGYSYSYSNVDHPNVKVGVLQSQILGDPDCDAVQRIVQPISVRRYRYDVYVEPGTYAPFNSQATIWPRRFAPMMAVFPGCGRYDDIYSSIVATRVLHHLKHVVAFGEPYVRQARNEHDLGKDLAAEVKGMNDVDRFTEFVDNVDLDSSTTDVLTHWAEVMYQLEAEGLLPEQTQDFWRDYLLDLAKTNWS